MRAGPLRHWVTIQASTETQNTHGEPVFSWVDYSTKRPAAVEQLSGRELWNAQQTQPDVSCRVRTRWLDGVTNAMRFAWDDGGTTRYLHIEGPPINPDGKRIELVCNCREAK